jgi:hypothetical protein
LLHTFTHLALSTHFAPYRAFDRYKTDTNNHDHDHNHPSQSTPSREVPHRLLALPATLIQKHIS